MAFSSPCRGRRYPAEKIGKGLALVEGARVGGGIPVVSADAETGEPGTRTRAERRQFLPGCGTDLASASLIGVGRRLRSARTIADDLAAH
ncbi:hypothetical protein RB628_21335 [Streptomyces sp. ADMS]|uniref:hypothetical protein n=1 Tax=Streptomyces sp. ADMS TaxID=3071415 RepID=UPI00296E31AB|nr:hypothetical protein [Streptomyces sp. ADMS]MDW4907825.1 hypothetical protein [Streptomyces sp. ADMS]